MMDASSRTASGSHALVTSVTMLSVIRSSPLAAAIVSLLPAASVASKVPASASAKPSSVVAAFSCVISQCTDIIAATSRTRSLLPVSNANTCRNDSRCSSVHFRSAPDAHFSSGNTFSRKPKQNARFSSLPFIFLKNAAPSGPSRFSTHASNSLAFDGIPAYNVNVSKLIAATACGMTVIMPLTLAITPLSPPIPEFTNFSFASALLL
mmetsp:Transcript_54672/g.133994  ORF Transcript_54672/g.133994 Transcript_54672/m.133994 type:complete len:208 (-) Transcript_54672:897-1520(-)